MIFDQPNIALHLKKFIHDEFNIAGVGTNDLLADMGLQITDEIELECFICIKFQIGRHYITFHEHRTFGDLIKHIYLMRFYRSVVRREMDFHYRDFYCLIGNGYTFNVYEKRPSIFRYIKAFFKSEKFIYRDIVG